MTDDKNVTQKNLPPEAQRALAEAAERRTQQAAKEAELEADQKMSSQSVMAIGSATVSLTTFRRWVHQ